MGNFHTAWDATSKYTVTDMTAPLTTLDRAITYLKNIIVSCDGVISYVKATGVLTWSSTIRIKFYTAAGVWVENTVAAGSVTLTDGQAAYVTLNETTGTALTVSAGSSGFLAYNVLVLAYRNTSSDNIYPVYLHQFLGDLIVSGTSGGLKRAKAEATGTPAGTTTYFDIAVNVPSGARLLGSQLRVDTALTAGETWGAAYQTGSSTVIAAPGQAVAKNTKVSKMHVDEITTGTTVIRITRDAGNFTNAVGVIRAIVYYEVFETMTDAA